MIVEEEPKEAKLHEWNILPKDVSPACTPEPKLSGSRKKKSYLAPITWTVSDLSKAGCLLSVPALSVNFDDEQEMRRVYSLIYDVFRYKIVLARALSDVAFFQIHPKLGETAPHVWLLFYDLYHRSFKKRETSVSALAGKLFDSVGLSYAENALWSQRVRLAAAVSRLRIKHNALSLDELLPTHLKDEKVTEHAKRNPVTCWINCLKVSDVKQLTDDIEKSFNLKMVSVMENLEKDKFKWDIHCPQIIAFHASMRGKLARSNFVKNHILIVQDKSFCRGAATFGKILHDLGLTGSVIQTHVNSPRTTAYLATLLTHNEKIKKLMAFSAGKRKIEYEDYFTQLGVTNIKIFSDRLIDLPPDASYMEEVVAVFATPPNSYSAVLDPIDLVCSRGGDLTMLEVLTESEETKETRERVFNILEEQRKTLRFAMSRPQIQFVLYETHSELEAENEGMVNKTLRDINRLAKLQHAALMGKNQPSDLLPMEEDIPVEASKIDENKPVREGGGEEINLVKKISMDSESSKTVIDSKDKFLENIQVPDTDLFTTPELPSLCPSENSCINFKKEGCYLSLIQRKEVIRLDDKYMIQMAENRGLFGSTTSQGTSKSKTSKAARKKQEKIDRKPKSRKKFKELEMKSQASQTSDESDDESEDSSSKNDGGKEEDDEEEELIKMQTCVSLNLTRSSTKSILARLTSAQIRQMVSPDYKQDFAQFYAPSLYSSKSKPNKESNSKVHKENLKNKTNRSISKNLTSKTDPKVEESPREKSNNSWKSIRKNAFKRVCSPTLSFALKTKKTPGVSDDKMNGQPSAACSSHLSSPCERFNRRNLKQ